jgi:hypothetical protein
MKLNPIKTFVGRITPTQQFSNFIKELENRGIIDVYRFDHVEPGNNTSLSREVSLLLTYNPYKLADLYSSKLTKEALDHYPEFHKTYFQSFISLQRTYINNATRYDQYSLLFRYYYSFCYDILKKNDIELLIFPFIPHYTFEYMLYQVAHLLGIKTLIFCPSNFPNKSFIFTNIQYFGDFDKDIDISDSDNCTIHEINNKIPSYIRNIKKIEGTIPKNSQSILLFFHNFIFTIKNGIKSLIFPIVRGINRSKYLSKEELKRISIFYEIGRLLMLIISAIYLIPIRYITIASMTKYATDDVDWNKKYVYFPLHFQPELSTNILGGIYEDQAYALECLIQILPDDWMVYVKENPLQYSYTGWYSIPDYWRNKQFFFQTTKR